MPPCLHPKGSCISLPAADRMLRFPACIRLDPALPFLHPLGSSPALAASRPHSAAPPRHERTRVFTRVFCVHVCPCPRVSMSRVPLSLSGLFAVWACCPLRGTQEALTPKSIRGGPTRRAPQTRPGDRGDTAHGGRTRPPGPSGGAWGDTHTRVTRGSTRGVVGARRCWGGSSWGQDKVRPQRVTMGRVRAPAGASCARVCACTRAHSPAVYIGAHGPTACTRMHEDAGGCTRMQELTACAGTRAPECAQGCATPLCAQGCATPQCAHGCAQPLCHRPTGCAPARAGDTPCAQGEAQTAAARPEVPPGSSSPHPLVPMSLIPMSLIPMSLIPTSPCPFALLSLCRLVPMSPHPLVPSSLHPLVPSSRCPLIPCPHQHPMAMGPLPPSHPSPAHPSPLWLVVAPR